MIFGGNFGVERAGFDWVCLALLLKALRRHLFS